MNDNDDKNSDCNEDSHDDNVVRQTCNQLPVSVHHRFLGIQGNDDIVAMARLGAQAVAAVLIACQEHHWAHVDAVQARLLAELQDEVNAKVRSPARVPILELTVLVVSTCALGKGALPSCLHIS